MNTRIVERSILHYTNKERRRYGRKAIRKKMPLKGHRALIRAARAHSRWMARNGRMSHTGGGGSRPVDRARRAGYTSYLVSENLWETYGRSGGAWKSDFRWHSDWQLGKAAVISWMNSPGHKANLLDSQYTHIGIGVAKNKRNRIYLTQKFGSIIEERNGKASTLLKNLGIWLFIGLMAFLLISWLLTEISWFDILARLVDYNPHRTTQSP